MAARRAKRPILSAFLFVCSAAAVVAPADSGSDSFGGDVEDVAILASENGTPIAASEGPIIHVSRSDETEVGEAGGESAPCHERMTEKDFDALCWHKMASTSAPRRGAVSPTAGASRVSESLPQPAQLLNPDPKPVPNAPPIASKTDKKQAVAAVMRALASAGVSGLLPNGTVTRGVPLSPRASNVTVAGVTVTRRDPAIGGPPNVGCPPEPDPADVDAAQDGVLRDERGDPRLRSGVYQISINGLLIRVTGDRNDAYSPHFDVKLARLTIEECGDACKFAIYPSPPPLTALLETAASGKKTQSETETETDISACAKRRKRASTASDAPRVRVEAQSANGSLGFLSIPGLGTSDGLDSELFEAKIFRGSFDECPPLECEFQLLPAAERGRYVLTAGGWGGPDFAEILSSETDETDEKDGSVGGGSVSDRSQERGFDEAASPEDESEMVDEEAIGSAEKDSDLEGERGAEKNAEKNAEKGDGAIVTDEGEAEAAPKPQYSDVTAPSEPANAEKLNSESASLVETASTSTHRRFAEKLISGKVQFGGPMLVWRLHKMLRFHSTTGEGMQLRVYRGTDNVCLTRDCDLGFRRLGDVTDTRRVQCTRMSRRLPYFSQASNVAMPALTAPDAPARETTFEAWIYPEQIDGEMSIREDAAGRERAGDTEAVCAFILPVAGVIQNLVQRELPLGEQVALADIAMKAAGAIRSDVLYHSLSVEEYKATRLGIRLEACCPDAVSERREAGRSYKTVSLASLSQCLQGPWDWRLYIRGGALALSVRGNIPETVVFEEKRVTALEWTHVAVSYSEAQREAVAYVNGTEAGRFQFTTCRELGWNAAVLGGCQVSGPRARRDCFYGFMKDLRIWRSVRTAEEINSEMIDEPIVPDSATDLVAYYPMAGRLGDAVAEKNLTGFITFRQPPWEVGYCRHTSKDVSKSGYVSAVNLLRVGAEEADTTGRFRQISPYNDEGTPERALERAREAAVLGTPDEDCRLLGRPVGGFILEAMAKDPFFSANDVPLPDATLRLEARIAQHITAWGLDPGLYGRDALASRILACCAPGTTRLAEKLFDKVVALNAPALRACLVRAGDEAKTVEPTPYPTKEPTPPPTPMPTFPPTDESLDDLIADIVRNNTGGINRFLPPNVVESVAGNVTGNETAAGNGSQTLTVANGAGVGAGETTGIGGTDMPLLKPPSPTVPAAAQAATASSSAPVSSSQGRPDTACPDAADADDNNARLVPPCPNGGTDDGFTFDPYCGGSVSPVPGGVSGDAPGPCDDDENVKMENDTPEDTVDWDLDSQTTTRSRLSGRITSTFASKESTNTGLRALLELRRRRRWLAKKREQTTSLQLEVQDETDKTGTSSTPPVRFRRGDPSIQNDDPSRRWTSVIPAANKIHANPHPPHSALSAQRSRLNIKISDSDHRDKVYVAHGGRYFENTCEVLRPLARSLWGYVDNDEGTFIHAREVAAAAEEAVRTGVATSGLEIDDFAKERMPALVAECCPGSLEMRPGAAYAGGAPGQYPAFNLQVLRDCFRHRMYDTKTTVVPARPLWHGLVPDVAVSKRIRGRQLGTKRLNSSNRRRKLSSATPSSSSEPCVPCSCGVVSTTPAHGATEPPCKNSNDASGSQSAATTVAHHTQLIDSTVQKRPSSDCGRAKNDSKFSASVDPDAMLEAPQQPSLDELPPCAQPLQPLENATTVTSFQEYDDRAGTGCVVVETWAGETDSSIGEADAATVSEAFRFRFQHRDGRVAKCCMCHSP